MSNSLQISRMKFQDLDDETGETSIGLTMYDDCGDFYFSCVHDEDGEVIETLPEDDLELLALVMRIFCPRNDGDELILDPDLHTSLSIGNNFYSQEEWKAMQTKILDRE